MAGTWVCLVTYNEAENLPLVLEAVRAALPEAAIIVVDDNSPDGTAALAQERAAHDPDIHVIVREGKLGYASAQRAAIDFAVAHGASQVVTMDADLSHDPAALPAMVAALDGADMAIGSRYVPGGATVGWPMHRQLLSRLGNLAFRLIGGLPARDNTSGYRAYRAEALERLDLASVPGQGYALLTQTLVRARRLGLRIAEVPITFAERRHGQSKMSSAIIGEQLRLLCRLAWQRVARRRGPG